MFLMSKIEESKEGEPVVTSYPHCGQKGHEGEACQLRYEAVHRWKKPYQGTRRQKKLQVRKPLRNSLQLQCHYKGRIEQLVAMVCVEDQTALHTPVWLNGVRIPRCLIDTGAEVNLISVKDAIKYGFSYDMGGIQKIKGFNGGISAVDGVMECDLRLGPCGEPKKVEFLVTSAATNSHHWMSHAF